MATYRTDVLKSGQRRTRVRIRIRGVYRSATFAAKREAERWARKEEDRALLHGCSAVEQSQSRTVEEMIDRYVREVLPDKRVSSRLVQAGQLAFWRRLLLGMTLAEVRAPEIAAAKEILRPRAASTINNYLSVLSHVYGYAVKEWEWCEQNPVRNVRRLPDPQPRVRYLTTDERARLLFYCRISSCPSLYLIVILALSTGPRKGEVRWLKFADYNPVRGEVYLSETKNGDRRRVKLFGQARDLVRKRHEERGREEVYFFPSPQEPLFRPVDFRYAWYQALEKAGIENFCFHDLRHSAASYLAWQGATLQDIQEIIGHRTIATTRKYTHLIQSRTDQVVEQMNRAYL